MKTSQTTLRFPNAFLREAKAFSAKNGITLTEFFFRAGELHMHPKPVAKKKKIVLPVFDGPFPYTPEELKRIDRESQHAWDMKKIGLTK